jgi:hypothetical protein
VVGSADPTFTRTGRVPHERVSVACAPLDALLDDLGVGASDVGLVWCDAQGSETTVLETGEQLWDAGVAIYLEIDPTSLALHGGVGRFLDVAHRHFTSFSTRLDAREVPQTIKELDFFVKAISRHLTTEALLIP